MLIKIKAWMGGNAPKSLESISADERSLVSKLFREQTKEHCSYWDLPAETQTLRTFWNLARHDAHAAYR